MIFTHDLCKTISRDVFDAIAFVDFIDWDALILKLEKEEKEFIFFVLMIRKLLFHTLYLSSELFII